jgi:hypothetical protein
MGRPDHDRPICPRCGGVQLELCGESVSYRPATHPDEPLSDRELHTYAYRCQCGMAFTHMVRPSEKRDGDQSGNGSKSPSDSSP